MTDEPNSEQIRNSPDEQPADDPISKMPPQLQAANRRRRAAKGTGNPPRQVDSPSGEPPDYTTLLARIEQLEQQRRSQFVDMAPEPQADPRLAALEQLSPWQQKLLEQTRPTPEGYGGDREPLFNIPDRLYLKPDGTFVWLQGHAKARAYYQEKGYHLLDSDETKHYLQVERPRLIREQRQKAHLIRQIRRLIRTDPMLAGFTEDDDWDLSLDLLNIEGLQNEWRNLCSQTNLPDRKLPAAPRFKSDLATERDPKMAGIETTPTRVAREKGIEPEIPDAAQPMPPQNGRGRLIEMQPGGRTFS